MTAPSELVARTRPLPGPVDLLRVSGSAGVLFARRGIGFAGRGIALKTTRDEVGSVLGQIQRDDTVARPGTGPVGFAALPFIPDLQAPVIVPELLVGVGADGTAWATTVAPARDPGPDPHEAIALLMAEGVSRAESPSTFTIRSTHSPRHWMEAVSEATTRIAAGHLDKVVLAREVIVTADQPIEALDVLGRLERGYPDCYLFLVDGLCGASPELLVSRVDEEVRAQPMAGTAPRAADPDEDDANAASLMASATYRHEHQVTIDAVHDTLLGFSSYVDYQPEPSVVRLANVIHLASSVVGRLSSPPVSVLELVDALHPTPAVCGRPRAEALRFIAEVEQLDRGRYAGAVGWVDADGNGEWAVSIRCAEIEGVTARAMGGCGIVADSDPVTELAESRSKLQAMLGALVRP